MFDDALFLFRVWTAIPVLALASSSETFDSGEECCDCEGGPGASGVRITDGDCRVIEDVSRDGVLRRLGSMKEREGVDGVLWAL